MGTEHPDYLQRFEANAGGRPSDRADGRDGRMIRA